MLKDILQVAGAPIKTGHDLVTTYFVQSIIQDDGKATLSLGQSRLREHHGVDAHHLAGAIEHFHKYNLDIQPPTLLKPVLQLLMTIPPDIHALSFNVQLGSAGLKMIADRFCPSFWPITLFYTFTHNSNRECVLNKALCIENCQFGLVTR